MMKIRSGERGQVLILLTAGIITLLGFAALAIDGGRVYSEKRTIQGIADTSSFTGALFIAQDDDGVSLADLDTAKVVAQNRAVESGLDISQVSVDVNVYGSYYHVEVILERVVDPVIAQLVYRGELMVRAKATARVLKVNNFAFGNALYAMNDTDCDALKFTGNGTIDISGTGIYSNSSCSTGSLSFEGSSTTVLTDNAAAAGGIAHSDNVFNPDGSEFSKFTSWVGHLGYITIDPPNCGLQEGTRTVVDGEIYFSNGVYPNGIFEVKNKIYHFAPGFYCIYGGFTLNNGTFLGDDVSFYIGTGNVSLGGNITFVAPEKGIAYDGAMYDWFGMLLYIRNGRLTLNGNADSYYEGTIYVPSTLGKPTCKLNGTSDSDGYNVQLVCDTIEVKGDGTLVLKYDGSNSHIPPTAIDLIE